MRRSEEWTKGTHGFDRLPALTIKDTLGSPAIGLAVPNCLLGHALGQGAEYGISFCIPPKSSPPI